MSTRLAHAFFTADTIDVARALLGQILVHRLADGTRLSGRIVETEAYLGLEDPAAHSFAGRRTPRTEVMFAECGTSYIYFVYGMHFCFNVVTAPREVPEAVLLRALEPLEGVATMQRRHPSRPVHLLANGPGKLCQALQLTREQNALDLSTNPRVWLERGDGAIEDVHIVAGPRVGIPYAQDAIHWPLRFAIKDSAAKSPAPFL